MPAPRHSRPPAPITPTWGSLSGDPLERLLSLEGAYPDAVLAVVVDFVERARPSWHRDAACRESDLDFTSRSPGTQARAVQVCGGCSVRTECLEWAFEIEDEVAVLGGMTPAARRAHRRAVEARKRKRATS